MRMFPKMQTVIYTTVRPRYLEEVNPRLSANENIKRMCFERDGVLFGDFKAIFSQVFGAESVLKQKILCALVDGPRTCMEVSEALHVVRGGSLAETLEVLVDAGFVTKDEGYNPETGKKADFYLVLLRIRFRIHQEK